jgi:pilus assembly protein Flp/PilA
MNNLNDKLVREERGATAIEYAIMASLIAGVVAATVSIIGGKLVPIYNAAVAMFP